VSGRGPRRSTLVALCAVGFALLNFPLLRLWDSGATVLGLPLLPVALFLVWAGLIGGLAVTVGRGRRGPDR
jgi:hypothetical protein